LRYSLTELRIGARNPSSVAILETKGRVGRVALGLGLRKLQVWPVVLEVVEEAARCSNRRDFVEQSQRELEWIRENRPS